MRVVVYEIGPDRRRLFEGDPSVVEHDLVFRYPWLRTRDPAGRDDLDLLLERLDSTQMFAVEEVGGVEVPEQSPELHAPGDASRLVRGAEFLTGAVVSADEVRRQLWVVDEDEVAAVLLAAGLPADETHRLTLTATAKLLDEPPDPPVAVLPVNVSVSALVPEDGKDVADQVQAAIAAGRVRPVQLGGKHSAGTQLVRAEDRAWLLKPGAGGQSTAAGAAEELAGQAAREAAFYHVVKNWGLFESFPRAEWLRVAGHQYAALQFLSRDFQTLTDLRVSDPGAPRRIFDPYLRDGTLHRWAIAYYVLGETDGHGGNCMADAAGRVMLLDHGSALAGFDFDPAHDERSFVPYFLRAWAPETFNSLPEAQKLSYLPRVSAGVAEQLGDWVGALWAPETEHVLARYSVDPAPSLSRLARVKESPKNIPADLNINRLWVTT